VAARNAPGLAADSSKEALTAQLHEVWDALSELGRSVGDDEWTAPTPCPGWDVAAQYAHVIGTESMLLGRPNPEVPPPEGAAHVRNQIGGFNEVWVTALAGRSRAEVLDLLDEVIGARKEALAGMTEEDFDAPSWTPVGQADYRRFMQTRTFDCWVHEQDVRDALGRPGHESGPAAEQALDEIVRATGFVVGKRGGAPEGSSVRIELTGPVVRRIEVEVTDRARVVDGLAGAPTAVLTLGSTAFARLSCGRITPAEVADGALGGVALEGDGELARRVFEHLAFTI
jgi:uncharacterized protein (TIGR03083 family)